MAAPDPFPAPSDQEAPGATPPERAGLDPGLDPGDACDDGTHRARGAAAHDGEAFERAVRLFKALGDLQRLRLLELLVRGEACVTELAESSGEALPAISQRLRLLRAEGLVRGRRDGKHVFYSIADGHVAALVLSALDHASEPHS